MAKRGVRTYVTGGNGRIIWGINAMKNDIINENNCLSCRGIHAELPTEVKIGKNIDLEDIKRIKRPIKKGEIERVALIWSVSYQGTCGLKGDYYSQKGILEYNVYDFILTHAVYPYYPYEGKTPRAFHIGNVQCGIPPEDRERFIEPKSNRIYFNGLGELALYIIKNDRVKKGKDYTLERIYRIFNEIEIIDDIPGQFYPVFKKIKEYYRNYEE